MNKESVQDEVAKLAPPGAGLPLVQKLVARYLVGPMISKWVPLNAARQDYVGSSQRIIEVVSKVTSAKRFLPVLVDPIDGLEDSSRYWSINATLDHLLLVSKSIENVILALSANQVLEGAGDPAKVKPTEVENEWFEEFKNYAPELMARIDQKISSKQLNLESEARFPHLWFGPMNARQWYWLLSRHQGIHEKQINQIIKGLN